MKRQVLSTLFFCALAASLAGCSLKFAVARSATGVLDDTMAALSAETDIAQGREAAASLLVLLEGFIRSDPENPALRRAAAQAYGSFSFGFLEKEEPDRARNLYRRGLNHGLRALREKPGFARAVKADLPAFRKNLDTLGEEDLPLLFWTAYCLSGWINLSRSDPDALADLPRAAAMMDRTLALDPGFFHGGPELFFGVYYGSRSPLLGGDPKKARAHFERAVAASGGKFLMAKFLYARHYAVQSQDKKLFVKLLTEVENAPPGILPDQALANALARKRARALREQAEELF